jgi:PAS domain S-box-containing protein
MRERLPRHELMEGWAGLIILTALTVVLISLPDGPWATALPEAMVFPFLLWVAIRCRPVFAAAAALAVGLTVIGSTALNVGNFDWQKPLADRILAAQTFVFIESILVVLLAAVFAERRRSERAVKQVADRLQVALDGAALGAFSADLATGQLACDRRAAQFHGHSVLPTTIKESRRFVHAEDLSRIDGALAEARRTHSNWKAEYRVVPPPGHPHAGETRWIAVEGSIERDVHGAPMQLLGVTRDITLSKRAQEHQRVLHAELNHRVKNVLAIVSAIAARTMDASSSMQHFVTSLDGRIRSMARTHDLLSATQWQGISVLELVRRELAPYATSGNTEITGTDVVLKVEAGQALAMVLHELVTNAAKYGALSTQNGRVSIRWHQWFNGQASANLVVDWREVGGPPVVAPPNSGFGMSTIRDLVPYEFGGGVDLTFAPTGVQCRLELPADWLINQ